MDSSGRRPTARPSQRLYVYSWYCPPWYSVTTSQRSCSARLAGLLDARELRLLRPVERLAGGPRWPWTRAVTSVSDQLVDLHLGAGQLLGQRLRVKAGLRRGPSVAWRAAGCSSRRAVVVGHHQAVARDEAARAPPRGAPTTADMLQPRLSSGENPYFFWTRAAGQWLKVHIPSSAREGRGGGERGRQSRVGARSLVIGIEGGGAVGGTGANISTESGPSRRSGNTPLPRNNPGSSIERPSEGVPARGLQASVLSNMRSLLLALTLVPAAVQAAPVLVPLSRGIELRTQTLADPGLGGPGRPVAAPRRRGTASAASPVTPSVRSPRW